jgi:hypothetical protein
MNLSMHPFPSGCRRTDGLDSMPTVLSSSWKACERVASNDLLAEIHYPDTTRINIGPIDKPQPTLLDYNRQGEVVAMRELPKRVGRERPTRLFIGAGCRNIDPDPLRASLRSLALSRVLASTAFGSRP